MSQVDYSDPTVDRKMSFQITRKGYGIHFDRYICFFDLGSDSNCSDELRATILGLAKIHYEADFLVGTTADTNSFEKDSEDDNLYLLKSLTEDEVAYLSFKSAAAINVSDSVKMSQQDIKQQVIESLKRDEFNRDETTKVAYFKINHSDSVKRNQEQAEFLRNQ